MLKTYVIGWKSKSGGRTGRGKTVFTQEEAEAVAAELNRDYPAFEHFPVNTAEGSPSEPVLELAQLAKD